MNRKKFDCVELMRNIREKHRLKYKKNPSLRAKRLLEIRKKFGFSTQEKIAAQ
jgi:hypothetical protein